ELEQVMTETGLKVNHKNYTSIQAEPYDLLISGYDASAVNTLRLWEAKAKTGFNMKLFERGEYSKSSEAEAIASSISKLLYPADVTNEGKELRIKQQYFFISASLQQLVKNHYREFGTLENFSEHVALHINDTHPAMGVAELMRLLVDEYGYGWDKAWEITTKTFAYTNHTIMAEALEKWPVSLFQPILPRIYSIIEEINRRFCLWVMEQGKQYTLRDTAIIYDDMIKMANLSIVGSHYVNGVSKLHSDILVRDTFKAFNDLYPGKFGNVTNGIAHRRWLGQAIPELATYLEKLIGDDFIKDLSGISKLNAYKDDEKVLKDLQAIKLTKKEQLATYIKETLAISVNPHSIFDVQVKRLHEYKRQLLNALHIVFLYHEIKYNGLRPTPRTFIFAAKASSGYQMAKNIIKFIHSISQMIESDELVREYIKVVFIPDYKVTLAEIILPAADVSEQISQAGKEASGTGNMKLMLNGAVTLGTMDGANVEIYEAVGKDNIVIFGLETEEVDALYAKGYKPWEYYNNSPKIKTVLDFIRTMTVGGMNFNFIVDYLLTQDHYMCLADFDSYVEAQERIEKDYNDSSKWMKMSLANIANAGIFSADRAVKEYAKDIWHIKPVQG
ncbi:MAG: glycogen/starch/alpha-glucan phosphorylase, partial [Streptococcus sp.]|nr:glycogen/starch/alpha-glucan phosphorylase [Streptococcus sp.]